LEIYKPNLIEAHAIFIASWISYYKSFYIRCYSIFIFFSQVIARPPKLNFLKRTQKCISFTISCFDAKHVLENKQLHREKQNKKYEPLKMQRPCKSAMEHCPKPGQKQAKPAKFICCVFSTDNSIHVYRWCHIYYKKRWISDILWCDSSFQNTFMLC